MKKIEAVIRPEKMDNVKDALGRWGIHGMTVTEVIGCGLQKGWVGTYRGKEYTLNLLPKIKIEIVTDDQMVDEVVNVIVQAARSGQIGDGKIFITAVADAVRIRTGESGTGAITPA